MKAVLSLLAVAFLVTFASHAAAQHSLPPVPDDRIADYAGVMQVDDRERLSRELQKQFKKNQISVYVATFQSLSDSDAAVADNLRQAWVAEPQGFIVLYNQHRDKLSISLTKEVFDRFDAAGELQELGAQIDVINKAGPATSVPLTVHSILNKLYPVDDGSQALLDNDARKAKWSFIVPGLIILAVIVYGLRTAWVRLKSQNVFKRSETLPVSSAQPRFGSSLGGTNFASVKFRQ
ncbi:MAG TPA: hypothetical protein VIT21_11335 [Chthoniobacterales bacterium]